MSSQRIQYFVAVERKVMVQSITFQDTLIDINLSCYFALDIKYPPRLHLLLLTIQRFVMVIKDKQAVPTACSNPNVGAIGSTSNK